MLPLSMTNPGEVNTIQKITGKDEVRRHLAQLGFVVGADVSVVSKLGESFILRVMDSRVAIDKAMAGRIMV